MFRPYLKTSLSNEKTFALFQSFEDISKAILDKFKIHESILISFANEINGAFETLQNKSLQSIKFKINELSMKLSQSISKTINMTEKEISHIREDVKLAKKQFYTKMDELKESAMKDAKFFEKNFSALTHASTKKQKSAPGKLQTIIS